MIFKPSNCYPLVSEIDLSKSNTFSCVNNTGGESARAYKLTILDKDGENIIYEPDLATTFASPVKNKGLIQIENIKNDIVTKVPAGTTYYSREGVAPNYTYIRVGELAEPCTYSYGEEYSEVVLEEHTYFVKTPHYYGNQFVNGKDYQWNIRVYNKVPGSTELPNTVICQGYLVGTTKGVVWLRLPAHGEGEVNYDVANLILYDRYIEMEANSLSQLVLGAHDDENKTFPVITEENPYIERLKIDWVEKELGTDKDIIKIETEDPFEYNFVDGVNFKIYQCSSKHTVKSLFADPNSNINVSGYVLVYLDLGKAQAGRDRGDLPESISLATMSGALSPCMKKVGGEDYAARKITGYSSDTGEMRFNDSFSCAPSNGEYYRLFSYNSTTKKYDPIDDAICKETHTIAAGTTTTVALVQSTFISKSQGEGSYIFTYNGSNWRLSDGVLTTTPTFATTGITLATNRFEFILKKPDKTTTTFTVFQSGENLLWTLDPTQETPTAVDITEYGLSVNIPEGSSLTVGDKIVAALADSDISAANLSSVYGITVTLPSGKSLASGDKITVNVQSDPLVRHRVGGSPITDSNYKVLSNKWAGEDLRLFIQPNINIKTDNYNAEEIVFVSNNCRVDINKQTTINTTTGKTLDVTFNKLDDTQWLLEGGAISYALLGASVPKDANNNIIPQSDYTVYSDFADASPYNVFYARKEPTLTLQIRNQYLYEHEQTLSQYANYQTMKDYHLKDPITGKWYVLYDTLESYLRKGCVYDVDYVKNKSVYLRSDSTRRDVTIDRYAFVTGINHNNFRFWNPGTYSFFYKNNGWYCNDEDVPTNIANYGLTLGSQELVEGQYFIVVVTQLAQDLKLTYECPDPEWTVTYDNNKLLHSTLINNIPGKYVLLKSTRAEESVWLYNGEEINLVEIGITISSLPADGTTITIVVENIGQKRYYAAWSLKDSQGQDVTELQSVDIFKAKVQGLETSPPEIGLYILKYNGSIWTCYNESAPTVVITTGNLIDFGLKLYDTYIPTLSFTSDINDTIYVHLGVARCSEDTEYETRSQVYNGSIAEYKQETIPYAAIYNVNNYYYTTSPAYDYREVGFNTSINYITDTYPQIKYYKYTLYSVEFVTRNIEGQNVKVEVDSYISSSEEIYSSDIEWSFKALEGGEKNKPNLYKINVDITDEYGAIYTTSKVFAIYYDSSTSIIPLVIDYDCHEQAVVINARDPLSVISTDEDNYTTVTSSDINEDYYLTIKDNHILNYDSVDHQDSVSDLLLPEELTWLTLFRIKSSFLSKMNTGDIKKIATLTHRYIGVNYTAQFAKPGITLQIDRNKFASATQEVDGEYSFMFLDGYWRLYSVLYTMADERTLEVISRNNMITSFDPPITNKQLTIPAIAGQYNNRTLLLEESGTKQDLDNLGITIIGESLLTEGDKFVVDLTTTESFDLTFSYPAGYYIDEEAEEDKRIKSTGSPASLQLYRSVDVNHEFPISCFVINGDLTNKKNYYSLIDNCGSKYGFQTSLRYVLQNPQGYEIKSSSLEMATFVPSEEEQALNKKYILTFQGRVRNIITDQNLTQGVWTYDPQNHWLLDRQTMYIYVQNELELPRIGYRQMNYEDIKAPDGTYSQPDYHYTLEEFGEITPQQICFELGPQGQDLFLIRINGVSDVYRFYYNVLTNQWCINSDPLYTYGTIPAGVEYFTDKELTHSDGFTTLVTYYHTEEISGTTYYYINIVKEQGTVKRYFAKPTYVWLGDYHIGIPFDFVPIEGSALNVYVGRDFLYVSSNQGIDYFWVDTPVTEITQTTYDNLWLTFYGVFNSEDTAKSTNYDKRLNCYIKWSEEGRS